MAGATVSVALPEAIREGLLGPAKSEELKTGEPQPLGLFYDLDIFDQGLKDVQNAFGTGFLHAIAVKANPVGSLLKIVCDQGLGAECASIGEILHCLDVGFTADRIVYDSPVKTVAELRFALAKGIHINADNFQEIEVIAEELTGMNWLVKVGGPIGESTSTIGLRVNPVIGIGDIKELSCASETSKFGVAMTETLKKKIIEYFIKFPWLTAFHVHIGSQSFDGDQLSKGLRKAVLLALEINQKIGRSQICVFDIGGGYPVNRENDAIKPTFYEYADTLRKVIPELFPEYGVFKKVITEFGQSLNAKAGWLASRVEYVKPSGDENVDIALIHVGADLCMRTCYCPQQKKYQRRLQVFSEDGRPKQGEEKRYNIGGPLCFSGDVLKYDVLLPEIQREDYIVLLDCGANSLSVLNRHCSRFYPSVFGYRTGKNGKVNFTILKEAETKNDLLTFLGGK